MSFHKVKNLQVQVRKVLQNGHSWVQVYYLNIYKNTGQLAIMLLDILKVYIWRLSKSDTYPRCMYHGNRPLTSQTMQIHRDPQRAHNQPCCRLYLDHRSQPICQSFHRHPVDGTHTRRNVLLDRQLFAVGRLRLSNCCCSGSVVWHRFPDSLVNRRFLFEVLPVRVNQSKCI